MGFLEQFLPPASRDAFAHKVMAALKKRKAAGPFEYDRKSFSIRYGGNAMTLNLENVYADYCVAKFANRAKVIRRAAKAGAGDGENQVPRSFAEAKGNILPRVRERFYYESVRLTFALKGMKLPEIPVVHLNEDLCVHLAHDAPDAVSLVDAGVLKRWEVGFGEVMKVALENLWKVSNEDFVEPSPGVFVGVWKDNHAASRMFLHDLIWQLPVKGGRVGEGGQVVMIPNRDTLLVTGAEDEQGLLRMGQMAESQIGEPRFMLGTAFVLRGKKWEVFVPGEGSAARELFLKLRGFSLSLWYAEQKKLLGALLQKGGTGEAVYAAEYQVVSSEAGQVASVTTWGKGTLPLLPETDVIGLMEMAEGRPVLKGFVKSAAAREAWPELFEATGDYPRRWRTKGFPTEEQMGRVGLREMPF